MKNQTKRQQAENRAGWLFMAPAMVIFMTMVVLAVIMSLALSFSEWNFLSGMSGIKWVGFKNFIRIFADRKFKMAMTNTLVYAITVAPISIALALLFAFLLNDKVFLRKFNRMCLFVPYISSMVALTAVFRFLFRSDGPVNMVLTTVFHVSEVPKWLTSSTLCKIPVICVMIYAGIGFSLIVYMAALQNVPAELYEASRVDGASGSRQFFKITLPLISPTTFYLCIVRLIAAFKAFTVINIMGMSGNAPSMVTEIYGNAFNSYKFGYASAQAWILVGVILIITLVQFKAQKRWVYY